MAFLCLAGPCQAQDKPVIYNELEGDGGVVLDRQIKKAYGLKYAIVDTNRLAGYCEPVPVGGEMPKSPVIGPDSILGGYVLAAYIVSPEGRVVDPVVIISSDPRLSSAALAAMEGWRFTPGTLKGQPVPTTAAQEFNFGPLDVSHGYELKRIGSISTGMCLSGACPPPRTYPATSRP